MNDKNNRNVVQRGRNLPEKRGGALSEVRSRALERRREKDEAWDKEKGIQRVRHGVDRPMLIIIIAMICLGSIMIFSASYPTHGTSYIYKHLIFIAISLVIMTVCSFLPYSLYKPGGILLSVITIILLVMVFVMGSARGVAQRWISVGSFTIQPSELAKISLVLLLSWYIDKHYDDIHSLSKKKQRVHGIVVPGFIMFGFCGMVLIEKHLSGTIILALIGACVIYLSGAKISQMLLYYGIPALFFGGGFLMLNSYALQRILTYTDSEADILGELWQTTQGLYAIGNGGLMGAGIGNSNLKHAYVSEAQNDFIFSIWCEEMGFIGAILLLVMYGLFIWRGIVIARRAPDTFSSLTAFGITCKVGIQAVLNIMVVTDMIFNTGVSLPFFSSGGSAMVVLLGEMGILLSISRHSYQKKI